MTLQNNGTIKNGTLFSSGTFALESGTVSAVLTGDGGLSKTTGGTVTLMAGTNYSSNTNVSGGTLKAGAANVFSANSVTTVMGATLDLGGFSQTIGSLTLNGAPNAYADESMAYAASGKRRLKRERDAFAAVYTKAPPLPPFEQRWSVWAAALADRRRQAATMRSAPTTRAAASTAPRWPRLSPVATHAGRLAAR